MTSAEETITGVKTFLNITNLRASFTSSFNLTTPTITSVYILDELKSLKETTMSLTKLYQNEIISNYLIDVLVELVQQYL